MCGHELRTKKALELICSLKIEHLYGMNLNRNFADWFLHVRGENTCHLFSSVFSIQFQLFRILMPEPKVYLLWQ